MNSKFMDLPIASIQAGHRIGAIVDFIIDPHKMSVVAFYVATPDDEEERVLFVDDITEMSSQGFIIDHDELLMQDEDDLVRLKEITELNFFLIDKQVETQSGAKVGKVTRFAVDSKGFSIMQIYVAQPMTVNLGNAEIIIHRNQITSVTDKKIVVKDAAVKVSAKFGFKGLLFGKQETAKADVKRSDSKR